MICYMGMIKDDEKRYAGFIKAIKAMVATTVEYIGCLLYTSDAADEL